jgi:ArsR family transcriptional regulator, arsenate/arsenite/antimonite-responsive transcriptional repressor
MNKLTDFFKVLSDETRLRILMLLYKQEFCVCEIYGILNESQPKVSKHLAKLRDMGYVKDERREQFIYYSLNLEDTLHRNILQEIYCNLEKYPALEKDAERIKDSNIFFEACSTKAYDKK